MSDQLSDGALPDRLLRIQERLQRGLAEVDPHRRLVGRPASYHVIAGQAFEIVYRDVSRIDRAELQGVQRLVGEDCYWSVTPQGRELLTVRIVVPLRDER